MKFRNLRKIKSGWLATAMFLGVLQTEGQIQGGKTVPQKPNILFCIADDASREHMSAYGINDWVQTPGFDRVAREGILFMNAYTPTAKCSPSRASILTGRNPWQLEEAANHYSFFPAKFTSFMETLAANGYHTGFTGKGWGPGDPGNKGDKKRELTGPGYNKARRQTPAKNIFPIDYTANFEIFLNERKEGEPFCFWYGGMEPHRPYEYGAGIAKGGKKLSDIDRVPGFLIDDTATRTDLLDYAFEVEYFDSHLQQMLDLLERRGELENTVIIVTSDNGMPFPRVKGHAYENAHHLPLALMWKGHILDPGRKIRDYISFIDFAPTILQLAGVKEQDNTMQKMQGNSFTDIIFSGKGQSMINAKRDHVLIGRERTDLGRPHDQGYPVRGIVMDGFIFTRNYAPDRWPSGNPETGFMDIDNGPSKTSLIKAHEMGEHADVWKLDFEKRPKEELYQYSKDTFSLKNLAGDKKYLALTKKMRVQMEQELKAQGDPRMLGKGEIFDQYPHSRPAFRNYYEKFMKGEFRKENK